MATSPGGITFQELEDSPRIKIKLNATTATRKFLVAWDDWKDFAIELLGSYTVTGTTTNITPPIEFPGVDNLIPIDVDVSPFMPDSPTGTVSVTLDGQHNEYAAGAVVTVSYETRFNTTSPVTAPNGTWVTLEGDLGAEMMTVPGRMFQWTGTSTNLPDDANPGILVPTGQFSLTWHKVLFPPWSTIRSLRGKVNSSSFLGAAAETVLFLGASYRRQFQVTNDSGHWEVVYRFAESSKQLASGSVGGWNHFWKEVAASGEHWVKIDAADNGELPYKTGDLSTLFNYGTTVYPS